MYVVNVSDASGKRTIPFQVSAAHLGRKAIDFVFDVIGGDHAYLCANNIIESADVPQLIALQKLIFGEDEQGKFIRDGISISSAAGPLDPDRPLRDGFLASGADSQVCTLRIEDAAEQPAGQADEFSRLFFIHHIAEGRSLDVTQEYPELQDLIKWAEREQLIEIDVARAAYKLTPQGSLLHQKQLDEAQELIKRYDIFSDVDIDGNGQVHFDSGLGRDLRIPIYEFEGVDPFRARLLIGMNDGEWKDEEWWRLATDKDFYDRIFSLVETAPSIDSIGKDKLQSVLDEGKRRLRSESQAYFGNSPHSAPWHDQVKFN